MVKCHNIYFSYVFNFAIFYERGTSSQSTFKICTNATRCSSFRFKIILATNIIPHLEIWIYNKNILVNVILLIDSRITGKNIPFWRNFGLTTQLYKNSLHVERTYASPVWDFSEHPLTGEGLVSRFYIHHKFYLKSIPSHLYSKNLFSICHQYFTMNYLIILWILCKTIMF